MSKLTLVNETAGGLFLLGKNMAARVFTMHLDLTS
ncbi:hypothetical protein DFAR_3760008 [Desulfarculales bacterium]